jgi:Uma2 family endonuclease
MTGAELLSLGDIGPCELVHGGIIHLQPATVLHAKTVVNLISIIDSYAETSKAGEVLCGPIGIYTTRDPDTVRGADIAFISTAQATLADQEGFLDIAPELVIEVISPFDRWIHNDRAAYPG